jgi:hypothetical protein
MMSPLAIAMGLVYIVIAIGVLLAWLDSVQPPIVGWLLYPIELVLNAIFFPHASTVVHGNGTAIYILSGFAVVLYIPYRLCRACLAFVMRRRS